MQTHWPIWELAHHGAESVEMLQDGTFFFGVTPPV